MNHWGHFWEGKKWKIVTKEVFSWEGQTWEHENSSLFLCCAQTMWSLWFVRILKIIYYVFILLISFIYCCISCLITGNKKMSNGIFYGLNQTMKESHVYLWEIDSNVHSSRPQYFLKVRVLFNAWCKWTKILRKSTQGLFCYYWLIVTKTEFGKVQEPGGTLVIAKQL